MALAVKIRKEKAEETRKKLIESNLFDSEYKILINGNYVLLPVIGKPEGFEVVDIPLKKRKKRKNFRDRLGEILTENEISQVRTSFDLIGDIAVVEIPPDLEKKEKEIARALLDSVKAVKAVFKKEGSVYGSERIRKLKFLAGEHRSETVHTENGIKLKLDIKDVYFSPRLSYERLRVLSRVNDGEIIVDLFAGIGPFALLIAKNRKVKVYALDINARAIEYLKENVKLNRLEGEAIVIHGDAMKVAPQRVADRVIMNLPKKSHEFLPLAFDVLKEKGGVIHFYTIAPEEELFTQGERTIKRIAEEKRVNVRIENSKVVRSYSPGNYHVVFDIRVVS
ncbi:ribosomal protein L11 methyltransferase [archaeon]|nr:ribosomal protein L11 methyltransferase [archaeon]